MKTTIIKTKTFASEDKKRITSLTVFKENGWYRLVVFEAEINQIIKMKSSRSLEEIEKEFEEMTEALKNLYSYF